MQYLNDLSDDELFVLLKEGSAPAFEMLYRRYWKEMLVVASYRVPRIADAEEIVQDIFVSLWDRRRDLSIQCSIRTYLASAIKYQVIKLIDKENHKRQYLSSLKNHPAMDDSTNEKIAFSELQSQLAAYVSELPEKCRLVYQLKKEQGLSQKQIAIHLHIAEKTVEAHLLKAMKVLRSKLAHLISLILFLLLR
ncbi:RNA polymerase sigma-70 factor [Olivibacter ginsenosidimutans]|uniref:RNA polymerase sigma-70 factor n=1 Tax=Olivibacter ginsenosidimutans TaxID=1176537 RepID=A0ABP9AEP0_9SPHI